jgi:hypothetical protein
MEIFKNIRLASRHNFCRPIKQPSDEQLTNWRRCATDTKTVRDIGSLQANGNVCVKGKSHFSLFGYTHVSGDNWIEPLTAGILAKLHL